MTSAELDRVMREAEEALNRAIEASSREANDPSEPACSDFVTSVRRDSLLRSARSAVQEARKVQRELGY